MLNIHHFLSLKADEKIHRIVRRHPTTLVWRLLGAAVCLALPFFLLFYLAQWKWLGWFVFGVLFVTGLFLTLRAFRLWNASMLIITTHRLCHVQQLGFWKRLVSDTPLGFVYAVECEREGWSDAVWGRGTLRLKLSGSEGELVISRLAQPERIQSLIHELREQRAWQRDVPSTERPLLQEALEKIRSLDDVGLKKVLQYLHEQ